MTIPAKILPMLVLGLSILSGCADYPAYRTEIDFVDPGCTAIYRDARVASRAEGPAGGVDDYKVASEQIRHAQPGSLEEKCWHSSTERHRDYDLYFVEFDDQGWFAPGADGVHASAQLDALMKRLEQISDHDGEPVTIIVYTHGWHHSAKPQDGNVLSFRRLLKSMADLEQIQCEDRNKEDLKASAICEGSDPRVEYWRKKRKVVGVYVGWRGDSVVGPLIENVSIWDRKLTAEKVSHGSINELFARLHDFYLTHGCHAEHVRRECAEVPDAHMLTLGHSFGGLITYRALQPRLLSAMMEHYREEKPEGPPYAYSYGDLTVLINPAFEGSRFEALASAAARRSYEAAANGPRGAQLPVLIVAQSTADWPTHRGFPIIRTISTLSEHTDAVEKDVNLETVGWSPRYVTHELEMDASEACKDWNWEGTTKDRLRAEAQRIKAWHENRYRDVEDHVHLCGRLRLTRVSDPRQVQPPRRFMPLWVMKTDKEIIGDHNDFLNRKFQLFVRQVYHLMLDSQQPYQDAGIEKAKAACARSYDPEHCHFVMPRKQP